MKKRTVASGLALLTLIFAIPNHADSGPAAEISNRHPVSVVEADIYVNRFKTTMRLTCFAEDLELLQGVEPFEDGKYDSDELLDATQDHAKYLAEKITIRNSNGELFKPNIVEIIDIEIPEEGITSGNLMQFTMGFVLEFNYDEPPQFITIQQDMIADGALLPSELKILMKQAGSDTPYVHMMKPTQPETFRFDWDAPILSSKASEEEWEVWFDKQREESLGITSYSSVYSFIYITNYEVRHEILIPLATLATLMEIERADPSFLEIDEQLAAAKKIEAYFSIGNQVTIDSVEVQPVFDRVDFYGLDLRDFAVQAEKRKVSMASGRVGIIMSYSTKGRPTQVEVSWDRFNDVILQVDAVIFALDKIEKTRFSRFLEDNTYRWQAPDRKPLPPITGIASTIDADLLALPTFKLPVISTGLLLLAAMAIPGALILGWRKSLWVPVVCGIASIFTWGIWQIDVRVPFAKEAGFEMEDQDARSVFAQLHKNMFRAFDYHHESDVYDALAKSVDGELLRNLYLQINQSLRVAEQGGAIAKIDEVTLLEGAKVPLPIEPEDPTPGFGYRSNWKIRGTIEHWGHIHERENSYEADFQVRLRDNAWKITQMNVIDEDEGIVKTSLRKYWENESDGKAESQSNEPGDVVQPEEDAESVTEDVSTSQVN